MSSFPDELEELQEQINSAKNKKSSITEELNELRTKLNVENIEAENKKRIKNRQEDLEEELQEINYEIHRLEEDIEDLIGADNIDDIDNISDKSKELLNDVESEYQKVKQIREKLEHDQNKLAARQEQLDDLEETAKGLLERTTSASLGEQFADRKSELEKTVWYWKYGAIISIIALISFSLLIYYHLLGSDGSYLVDFSKVALLLPVSVAVWFTVSNYSRQKRLMEEYEFKARMALSLPGFREVLEEQSSEDTEQVEIEFIVNTMNKIYSNPHQNILSDSDNPEDTPLANGHQSMVKVFKQLGNS